MDVVFRLAGCQKGLVTRLQLLQAGIAPDAVDYMVATGRLVVVHRGVYAAGPVLEPWAMELAAVLACRRDALVSHRSAARLWGLTSPNAGEFVDITVMGGQRGRCAGIRLHRAASRLPKADQAIRHGIPVTSAARTLLDLAGEVCDAELRRAFDTALQERIVTMPAVKAVLARNRGRRGAARLGALLPENGREHVTRSHMERHFLRLLKRYGLPLPATNVSVCGFVVDCYWEEAGLVVELDGYRVHSTRLAFEADRRRNAALLAAGLRLLRLSWRQLEKATEPTMVQVGQALVIGRSDG